MFSENRFLASCLLTICLISNSGQIEFSSITTSSTHHTWLWKRQDFDGPTYCALKLLMVPQNSYCKFPCQYQSKRVVISNHTKPTCIQHQIVFSLQLDWMTKVKPWFKCMSKSRESFLVVLVQFYYLKLQLFPGDVPVKKQIIRW